MDLAARPAASYSQRIAFVSEMAGRLHRYGTTAQRLEAAVTALSQRLDLECEAWSNPTGLIPASAIRANHWAAATPPG
jgi:uncharacterized membrane protein YjjP (DUF1212 family)